MEDSKEQLISIYKEFDIDYWTEGKNVSDGSVNVNCPFCDDPSNHCGFFPETQVFSCWRCQSRGPAFVLLATLLNISYEVAENMLDVETSTFKVETLEQLDTIFDQDTSPRERDRPEITTVLPEYTQPVKDLKHRWPLLERYKERRQISHETLLRWGCGICKVGECMNRLIIPVYSEEHELVAYQAADLTGLAELKYNTSKGYINDYLYGYNLIIPNDVIYICEGILDQWRMGLGAVGSFGTSLTDKQRHLILQKNPQKIVFCWDDETFWKAREQAAWFRPFINTVLCAEFPKGYDPDLYGKDYGTEKLYQLIGEAE